MKILNAIKLTLVGLLLTACSTPKNIVYFQDLTDGQIQKLANYKGIALQPMDMISIVVNTKSAELSNMLNLPVSSHTIGYAEGMSLSQSRGTSGYTLDSKGDIDFPLLGKLHLAGMNREEAAAFIKQKLEEGNIATNAVVTIEFMNLSYQVLGETNHSGRFSITKDKVTIVEALSSAGDMTLYGMRDSVVVMREQNGERQTYVVNMLSGKDILESPAYYIQQGDVIYVKPNNYRRRQSTANASEVTTASFWLSALSVLATLSVLIFK